MNRAKFGFQNEQERENDRKNIQAEESARREQRKQSLDQAVQQVGSIIRETLVQFFRGQGLSTVDFTGDEQFALLKEVAGNTEHTWVASSWKKTGTHTEYRADGAHLLDEHTAYTLTLSLFIDQDNLPLLYLGGYTASKLVGKKPVVASNFSTETPGQLKDLLRDKPGIRLATTAEYFKAQDR